MFRNYLTTQERAKFEQRRWTFFVERMESELLKNVNTGNVFNAIHDRSSLQQVRITELMETMFNVSTVRMNDQQQSLGSLANSTVD